MYEEQMHFRGRGRPKKSCLDGVDEVLRRTEVKCLSNTMKCMTCTVYGFGGSKDDLQIVNWCKLVSATFPFHLFSISFSFSNLCILWLPLKVTNVMSIVMHTQPMAV